MLQQATISDRILELVRANPDCTLEEVTQQFPELHWYDVYIEVERLSRSGDLQLIHRSVPKDSSRLTSEEISVLRNEAMRRERR